MGCSAAQQLHISAIATTVPIDCADYYAANSSVSSSCNDERAAPATANQQICLLRNTHESAAGAPTVDTPTTAQRATTSNAASRPPCTVPAGSAAAWLTPYSVPLIFECRGEVLSPFQPTDDRCCGSNIGSADLLPWQHFRPPHPSFCRISGAWPETNQHYGSSGLFFA